MGDFAVKSFSAYLNITQDVIKYKSKSHELFIELGKILALFDNERFKDMIKTRNVVDQLFYKQHENYEEAKMTWLELGFHL